VKKDWQKKERLQKLKKTKITPEDSSTILPTLNGDINHRLGF
jgi:hypothetical protein